MIVAAHQPHFLPWLGYLNKLANADVFVWLDTVQYRKNYFQNRTRIIGRDGAERWLTLPVHASLDTCIADVAIADPRWRRRVRATLEECYGRAPHFVELAPPLLAALEDAPDALAEANLRLLRVLLTQLGLTGTRVVRASELGPAPEEPSERLAALCARLGATTYVAGRGGHGYMRAEPFAAHGIGIAWQAFDVERTAYARPPAGTVARGVSVVDALFHVGAARTRELVRAGWSVEAAV